MNHRIDFKRIYVIAAILSLFLLYALLWVRMISTKFERDGSDFMGLYSGGRIAREYGFPEIYDIEKQINVQSAEVGFAFPADQTSYFTHPPFIILLVALIAGNQYSASLILWSVFLLILNVLFTYILMKSLVDYNFDKANSRILAFGIFLFWPTFSGIMNGQDALILSLGVSLWMIELLAGNQISSGLWLGLSAIRPQTAIFLSIPFLFRKQKVLLGFVIGAGTLALISLALIGLQGLHKYTTILNTVEGEMWRLPHAEDMPTISGIIRRNFHDINKDVFRSITWAGFLTGLTIISFWWRRNIEIHEKQIGLLVLAGLIFVPYAHYHELSLLLIPMFCLIRVCAMKNLVSQSTLSLLPLTSSILLMLGFIGGGIFKYTIVYLLMFTMTYLLLFSDKLKPVMPSK